MYLDSFVVPWINDGKGKLSKHFTEKSVQISKLDQERGKQMW